MKITNEQFAELKEAVNTVADKFGLSKRRNTSVPVLWAVLHEVQAQKSYGEDHPRWQTRPRVLKLTHPTHPSYLTELYNSGLNDCHIETALKKIASEWEGE